MLGGRRGGGEEGRSDGMACLLSVGCRCSRVLMVEGKEGGRREGKGKGKGKGKGQNPHV